VALRAPFPDTIEYEISLKNIEAHDPTRLRQLFQNLSLAVGADLAAMRGSFNITVDAQIPKQPYNHPDVRAYCTVLARHPLGLPFFLHPDSKSLNMLAYGVASNVKTVDNAKTGDIIVTATTSDITKFLSADLEVAHHLFKRSGLGEKEFEKCVQRITAQFHLKPEDWA
jgi:hypothetical protein